MKLRRAFRTLRQTGPVSVETIRYCCKSIDALFLVLDHNGIAPPDDVKPMMFLSKAICFALQYDPNDAEVLEAIDAIKDATGEAFDEALNPPRHRASA